jgi:hypothetical protein
MRKILKLIALGVIVLLIGILIPSNALAGGLSAWTLNTNFPNNFAPSLLEMTRGDVLLLVGGIPDPDEELRSCNLYKSTDFGTHWNSISATPVCFSYLTSSSDGLRLTAAAWGGEVFNSSNGGTTWTNQHHPDHWWGFSSSSSGEVVVGITEKLTFWVSRDFGVNWVAPFDFAPTTGTFTKSAISSNGQKILVGEGGAGYLYLSKDSGVTWSASGESNDWLAVAMSGDGNRLFAAASNDAGGVGGIYVSVDDGATWTQTGSDNRWWQMESTSDGRHLIATPTDKIDNIFVSNDLGLSWQPSPGSYLAGDIALSNNGQYAFALLSTAMDYQFKLYSAVYNCGIGGIDTCAQQAAAKVDAEAAAAKREAEKQSARSDITSKLLNAKNLTVDVFVKAEIPGITSTNIAAVQAELLALPEASRADINLVLKVAHKYEVVGNIASDQINYMQSNSFVEIGLISADSKNKASLVAAIRKLPAASRDTYAEIKVAIDAVAKEIQSRKDHLAQVIGRNAARKAG